MSPPTRVRILEAATDRVRAEFTVPGVDPDDATTLLLLLAREARTRRLGDPDDYRVQAWHQRRGWVEHRRP